jgi:hypothetical protein
MYFHVFSVRRDNFRILSLSLILSIVGLLYCTPGRGDAPGDALSARGWQKFPRRVTVLKEGFKGNYEHEVVKNDYFIFQKKVLVNQLLDTNGGDVLIVADELIIEAPIDTRVSMRMTPDYWLAAPPGQDDADFSSLGLVLRKWAPDAFQAFDSLYLWRDFYDPKKKKFVHGLAERPSTEIEPGSQSPKIKVAELHQLPSGQVPLASIKEYDRRYDTRRPTDGTNAPSDEVIWSAVRSGTIRIYASKITLCTECEQILSGLSHPMEEVTIPITVGDPFDEKEQAVFFQASGLKGGRGAAGSMYNALFGNLIGMRGGLSGLPGRAGDAGSVELHFVNRHPTEDELNQIRLGISIKGGVPAQSHRQRTPSLSQIRSTPTRTSFQDEVKITNLETLQGTDGKVSVDFSNTDDAIRAIDGKLAEAELAGNYSIELLVGGAQTAPDLFFVSPTSTLQTFLAQELVRLQNELLDLIEARLASAAPKTSFKYSPFFESLTCRQSGYATLTDTERAYLSRICEFRPIADRDPVTAYLLRVGGIYTDIPDANASLRYQSILVEMNRTQQLIHAAISEMKELHILVFDAITEQQRQGLVAAIQKLEAARAALQEAYEAALAKQPGLGDALKEVVVVVKDVADGIANFYSSNWVVAGEKFDGAMSGIIDLSEAYKIPPDSPSFAELDAAIKGAQKGLKEFAAIVEATKSAIIKSQGANIRDLIVARERIEGYRASSRFEFDRLVRATVQEYFQTSNSPTLKKNIEVIRSSVNEKNVSTTLELPSLRQLCLGNPTVILLSQLTEKAGCIEFDRQSSYVVVSKNKFADFPLLVVTKSDGTITRSFEQAFRASEIERLPMPPDLSEPR